MPSASLRRREKKVAIPRRAIVVIAICVAAVSPLTFAADEQLVFPILRFSISEEKVLRAEYIGREDGKYAGHFRDAPDAKGRMVVDCSDLSRIGVALEPRGIGSWIYGANRKYRFEWAHSEYPGESTKRMRFQGHYRTGLMEDRLRFDRRREHWLVNGIVTVTVTVKKRVRFETRFTLQNCDANKFRSRIAPSDLFRETNPEPEN